ncbi:AraC-like DNA-binding protein [Endobacter medicaginis]|jgi:AraC family transcriptional regulator|uniref:AraC-like DNA-binding protein n=1 Tax=Endobacter medicaginis TaxID=1181271 RepID=A0A850NRP3_9PROT|nr:AraC family transcriptional regulator [Endobacter medicaginis]MBB3172643.1 AraC-like DNA-binding protein [Endobacter medicaginis]MCX5475649.1 AraC family transcriptional regulator [Endobacter medicaginis]NVN31564.1 helix-turn-helix transcriptional regulator [Endobacter medicaginis]
MEHSRIGAIAFDAPAAPFHHLALPLEPVRLRFGLRVDGRQEFGRNAPFMLTAITAGTGGLTSWDGAYESACFYFSDASLGAALGRDDIDGARLLRTRAELHAPELTVLLHALHADAAAGQPHGRLVGDSVFVALAGRLAPEIRRAGMRVRGEAGRVARALQFIHAHLTDVLDLAAIADASATSPFHLARLFRAALGCSIWQYVLRERARLAVFLMRDPAQGLASIAQTAGFDTYAGFIDAVRREYGESPGRLRRALCQGVA